MLTLVISISVCVLETFALRKTSGSLKSGCILSQKFCSAIWVMLHHQPCKNNPCCPHSKSRPFGICVSVLMGFHISTFLPRIWIFVPNWRKVKGIALLCLRQQAVVGQMPMFKQPSAMSYLFYCVLVTWSFDRDSHCIGLGRRDK